jgi:hypothetical protein
LGKSRSISVSVIQDGYSTHFPVARKENPAISENR